MKRDRQHEGDIISVERHNRDFLMIDNSAVQDPNLSLKATGLLSLLISYPRDWKISLSHLCGAKVDGRDSILSGLAELSQAGYLLYLRWRDSGGLWASRYIVFETPSLKEQYLERMPEEDIKKITDPFSPSKAKAKKQKIAKETTMEIPQWNDNGETVTENPQWKNRSGKPTLNKDIYTNTDHKNTLQKDPPTPQGGTGFLSQEGGILEEEEDRNHKLSELPQTLKQDLPEQIKSSSEDQKLRGAALFYRVSKEDQDRIKQVYNSGKPKLWQPINNFHRAIKVKVEGLISSEDFSCDIEAFLTCLQNALSELNDPATKFNWFVHQGNLGIETLCANYGEHLFKFSNAWTERQKPQVQSNTLPDWALEAQKEIESRQLKKAG